MQNHLWKLLMFHVQNAVQKCKYVKQRKKEIIIFVKIIQNLVIIFHGISQKKEKSGIQKKQTQKKKKPQKKQENQPEKHGGLNRVLWYCEVYNKEPSLELAKEALEVLIKAQKAQEKGNYEAALSVISNTYSISTADLLGKSRNAKYVLPRHIAMYILKTHFGFTYSKIGAILNGRDHTTIMNGCTKIEEELKTNQELKMAINIILKKL